MNLKIGLDLDGVIIDHTINKIKLAKQKGYFLKSAQTSSNVMKKFMPLNIYRAIQKGIYGKEGLSSKQMKNAKKILRKMIKTFPVPCIISRRGIKKNQVKFAIQWLKKNNFFLLLDQKRIFFVNTDVAKNTLCKKLGINVYLDDKIKVLNTLPSIKYHVLFDLYGHYYKSPPPNIKVVKSWPEFYKYLQGLSEN